MQLISAKRMEAKQLPRLCLLLGPSLGSRNWWKPEDAGVPHPGTGQAGDDLHTLCLLHFKMFWNKPVSILNSGKHFPSVERAALSERQPHRETEVAEERHSLLWSFC
ncbi:Uncharacterised protein [Chlamydia trachomatis]|nr:Uncharacterised protein [Chlamydia trachomatis]